MSSPSDDSTLSSTPSSSDHEEEALIELHNLTQQHLHHSDIIERPIPYPYHKSSFGTGIYATLNNKVECRPHTNPMLGRGLYAKVDIPEGTCIWYEDADQMASELITFDEMERWRKTDPEKFNYHCRYAFQVDDSHLVAGDVESDASFFMNHSCDPNVWFVKENAITARRFIRKGEELCYDYATTECKYLDFETCCCLSEKCRGRVGPDDWMIPELHEKYGNHYMPYILHRLDAQRGVLDS